MCVFLHMGHISSPNKPTDWPTNWPTNGGKSSIRWSNVNHRSYTANELINQTTDLPTNQLTNQPTNQPTYRPTNRPTNVLTLWSTFSQTDHPKVWKCETCKIRIKALPCFHDHDSAPDSPPTGHTTLTPNYHLITPKPPHTVHQIHYPRDKPLSLLSTT